MILGVIGYKFLSKVDALLFDTRRYLDGRAWALPIGSIPALFFWEGRVALIPIDFNLLYRLERAEHLIHAEILTYKLAELNVELKTDELTEQAEILRRAQNELWQIHAADKEV